VCRPRDRGRANVGAYARREHDAVGSPSGGVR
jgi:hypothetical protein